MSSSGRLSQPFSARELRLWLLAALVWRIAIAALTPVPSEDGVNYLWMAERLADGRPDLALEEVFPPLYPLVIAPLIALGLESFRAAQLVACLCGAATLLVLVRLCRGLVPGEADRNARLAVLLVVAAPLPSRLAGEVYTEPMFHLLGAISLLAAQRGRFAESGLWSGMSFWLRPEGALIAVALSIANPRRAPLLLAGAAVPILALAWWRDLVVPGSGFELVPKLDFNAARLTEHTASVSAFAVHFFGNVAHVPWLWLEAFAVTGLLAWLGLATRGAGREVFAMQVLVGLGVLVICAFLPRRRFLVAWFFAIVPLALIGLRRLPARGVDLALILVLIGNVLLSFRIQDHDRYAERMVGEYLAEKLAPGETVAGDMTRVIYFSGGRPLPPRHFHAAELVARAARPGVRFVVLGERRDTTPEVRAALLANGYREFDMPSSTRQLVQRRGIVVFAR